jgi:hypothetical protein
VCDLGCDERESDQERNDLHDSTDNGTSRPITSRTPHLLGHSGGAKGVRFEAAPLVRPHHGGRRVGNDVRLFPVRLFASTLTTHAVIVRPVELRRGTVALRTKPLVDCGAGL